jgi:hypothetical protein
VDDCTLDDLPLERLETELTGLAGHLAAGECRFLVLLAAYDRREGWREWGCRSCAHWLSWRCGLDIRTAQEKLRVAHALELFPKIRAAFATGRISYSKARALTRIAGPTTEAELVVMAQHATAAHMEAITRGYRRAERSAERNITEAGDPAEDRAHGRRVDLRDHDDPDLATMAATLTHEELELVVRALDSAGDEVSRADALVLMAESFLAAGHACRRGSDRTLVMLNVDETVLRGDDSGTARIVGGPAIAPETARRLCCDASITWLLQGADGEPVNISARQGSISRALRRLVSVRDQGRCRFPGCAEHRYTEIHHLRHRQHGGTNSAANLATLCWFHHRVVHEGGWSLRHDVGGFVATNPAGLQVHGGAPAPQGTLGALERGNTQTECRIDSTTIIPKWGGEGLDLGWAVTSLYYANHPERRRALAERASAVRAQREAEAA